jgi:endonuclease/exonuclease/phosphatase family metal-dependent hydrolase
MTTADENKFRGNEDKGQAILSRWPILEYDVIPLPMVEGVVTKKDFSLIVAKIDHPKFAQYKESLWVATTHLWSAGIAPDGSQYENNDDIRLLQATEIATYLNRRVGSPRRYILTGDFNTGPKTAPIDLLHRVNRDGSIGTAKFWEGDQALYGDLAREGRPTVAGRKIDYFFAQHKGVHPYDGIGTVLIPASANGGDCHEKILRSWVRFADLTPA